MIRVRTADGFEQNLNMTLVSIDGVPFEKFQPITSNPNEVLRRLTLLEFAFNEMAERVQIWDARLETAVIKSVQMDPDQSPTTEGKTNHGETSK